jgi:Trp operon repressor
MTHVSRKKLDKSVDNFLDKLIVSTFSNLSSYDSERFLKTIISQTEREMIRKRLGILLLLELGTSVDEITKMLKVTRQTVSRMSLLWKTVPGETKKSLRRKLKTSFHKESLKGIFKNLDISYTTAYRNLRKNL